MAQFNGFNEVVGLAKRVDIETLVHLLSPNKNFVAGMSSKYLALLH